GLGVSTLMVEGGAAVIASFLRSRLVDRLVVTIAPCFLGGYNPFGIDGGGSLGLTLNEPRIELLGTDVVIDATPLWP
ncbi:MAG TPA: dihydrofolate reductase family protein, partial [Rectinemataceae bacterium]|nr:dihydrofolate reductase family protein [Rectinemataceae bacterium]